MSKPSASGSASSSALPSFWDSFGPGLLWAGAAIGVSHLVQSTRAGADAGFALAGVILLALILKYPFFEFGPRYAAATGESLVEGYARIGKWALWLYIALTLSTSLIIQAAIVLFTSFLLQTVFGLTMLPLWAVGGLLILVCAGLLRIGRFRGLDRTIKTVLILLSVSTLFAAGLAAPRADLSTLALWPPASAAVPLAFILALAGWMPSAIDVAVWSSMWTLAKSRDKGSRTSVAHAVLDFRIGYVGTGILAFAFLSLGAGVMYHSGTPFSPQGTRFSIQLVDLYSQTLGDWTRPIVMIAVLTTMFSTALTVIDGFPRAIGRSVLVLRDGVQRKATDSDTGPAYWISGAVLGLLTVIVMMSFAGNLTSMVDFATIVSFATAPVLGYLNLKVITGANVALADRPGSGLMWLSYVGLVGLGGMTVVYAVSLMS
jgi:Mn2+/Fe2+ NRAMP family transporter